MRHQPVTKKKNTTTSWETETGATRSCHGTHTNGTGGRQDPSVGDAFALVPADVLAGFSERNETKVEHMPASIDRKHTENRNPIFII